MRKLLWVLAGLSLAALVVGTVGHCTLALTKVLWVGSRDLTVHIERTDRDPIRLIVLAASRKEHVEEAEERGDPQQSYLRSHMIVLPDYDGKPIHVLVQTSGRCDGFGRGESYAQYKVLAIWVERKGKPRQRVLVDIPDVRYDDEVTVVLP
jgi:hypothetical protein